MKRAESPRIVYLTNHLRYKVNIDLNRSKIITFYLFHIVFSSKISQFATNGYICKSAIISQDSTPSELLKPYNPQYFQFKHNLLVIRYKIYLRSQPTSQAMLYKIVRKLHFSILVRLITQF